MACVLVHGADSCECITGARSLHDQFGVCTVVDHHLIFRNQQADRPRYTGQSKVFRNHRRRLNTDCGQPFNPFGESSAINHSDGNFSAASAGAGGKMQLLDIFSKVFFECIGQGRMKPCSTLYRNVDTGCQYLGAGHENDYIAITDVVNGFRQRARHRRASARAGAVDGDPVDRMVSCLADSNYKKFRHTQAVPKLRRIAVTLP